MTDAKQPPEPGNFLLIREYIEVRLNLLVVANDKLEASIDRRFGDVAVSTALAAKGIDERFKHLEQIVTLGQETSKRAVDKAEAAQSAHNVASNEWRGTLNDFKTTLVNRAEFDKLYSEFAANKLEVSKIIAAQSGNKEGISSAAGVVIVVVTIIIAALGVFVSTRNSAPVVVAVPAQVAPISPPQAAPR